tara:strand:+ start:8595 stop:10520 length:1926 start_codon:yes stop_codon:yes gene_type:complete
MTAARKRSDFWLLLGALIGGLLIAAIVALPAWVVDSRTALEIRFEESPQGSSPYFKLRYDRGRGMNSLRVVEPTAVRTEDPDRFRWVFDSRPMQAVQVEVRDWAGPLTIESAVLTDQTGRVLHEFDVDLVYSAEPAGAYPAQSSARSDYHRIVLPLPDGQTLPRNYYLSPVNWRATVVGFVLGVGIFWIVFQLCRTRVRYCSWLEKFRKEYPLDSRSARPKRWIVYSSLGTLALLVFLRSWENFIYPSLFVEDSFHYFNYYYDGRIPFLSAVLRHPNGYLNVLPNVVAWGASFLDVRSIPGAYVGFAVAFSLFAAMLPLATGWFRSGWIVFIVPLVLGLSGLNHLFYLTTLTFQMYVSILVLLTMMFMPASKTGWGLACRIAVGALLVFSGPYSVVAVPVGILLLALYRPSKQSFFWASMVFAGVLFKETTPGMVRLENLSEPATLEKMFRVMNDRIFFFNLVEVSPALGLGLIVLVVVALFGVLWRNSDFRRIGFVFISIVGLAMAPLFLSHKFVLYSDPYDCHILISQFFWLLFLLYGADCLIQRFGRRFPLGPIFAGLFAVFVLIDQWENPHKRAYPPNRQITEFVNTVYEAEQSNLAENNEFVLIEGEGASQEAFSPRVRVGSSRMDAVPRNSAEFE